jgi:hypothetical protein
MSQRSNGTTPEFDRNVMPPYHLGTDLLEACSRVRLNEQHPGAVAPEPKPDSTSLRIDPMNPETAKIPHSMFPGIDPLNREPGTNRAPN